MRRLQQRLALLLLGCLLTACAGVQREAAPTTGWDEHRQRLAALQHWTAAGKLAVRSPEQSESASLLWQQVGQATHLRLTGPLGVSATTVDSDGREVLIRRGTESSQLDISDPDSLYHQTGWNLPLAALPHWLKGIPDPAVPVDDLSLQPERELLRELRQSGWLVRYESYGEFDGLLLPTAVRMLREGYSVRLLLRDWRDFAP
jgi:outer membrane lipoprotein LolB